MTLVRDGQMTRGLRALGGALMLVDEPDLARRCVQTPVNSSNRYSCILKAIATFETVLRVRWAVGGVIPNSGTRAIVYECLALMRTAAISGVVSPQDVEWVGRVVDRIATLARYEEG